MEDSNENIIALKSPIQSNPDLAHGYFESFPDSPDDNLRFAKFSLSLSDTESVHTTRTSSQASLTDIEHLQENNEHNYGFRPGSLQLSLILGISEDEKAENRLAKASLFQYSSETNANFSEDEEFDFLKDKSLRKCISLKTSKTPPSTPGKKKAVRFADALGLDLTSIRHVIDFDEPPVVPESATRNLKLADDLSLQPADCIQVCKLCICFLSPDNSPDFLRRVQERKVLLENCFVDDQKGLVYGKIRVMNMAFHKVVNVRYTMNGWMTHTDIGTIYDSGSNDGATDKFSYSIKVPEYFQYGNSMEFSLKYISASQTYWDNNYGNNYRIECYIASEPSKLF